jgi:DNA-binding CsgD family transcriptional regulator
MALNGFGLLFCFMGEPERGLELLTAGMECCHRLGDRSTEAWICTGIGYARALCGDTDGAVKACDQALALARGTADAGAEAAALWRSGFTLALAGDFARARSLATASVDRLPRTEESRVRAYAQLTIGDCLTHEGRPAEAITVLREALALFEALPERWGLLRVASLLAEACAANGDWPRAAMLVGVVDTLSERTGGKPQTFMQTGLDKADAGARQALGRAWQAAKDAGRVVGRGDQITTVLWPTTSRDPADDGGLPLTPREREIAALIARGLTNRRIGAQLYIAERTVDTHVGRILAKLGCTTRAQVAALVTATGAIGDAERR